MSYEVLAQKWRPQLFKEVVGQTHVIITLQNQIRSSRIGHAYLFWGPRGTGKTTVARLFAKAVNCPNRQRETTFSQEITAEPCNQCQSCTEISQGSCLDVIEMDAASNRGIDPIRELRENTKLSPATCPHKIYIIDEVHMLTQEAFNALLKTLEEPPPHVIFILATTDRHKLPKTITSRCQDFDFRYLELDGIVERLHEIGTDEEISIDDGVLSLIARQSEGCLRDAENLLERLIASSGKELTVETVHQILGLGSSHLINELTDAVLECNLSDALQVLDNLAKQGTDLTQCLDQLLAYFRDLRLLAINSQDLAHLIQGSKSDLQRMKEKAELISKERASRIIKILMHTNHEIKQYGFAQVHLESALIDICSIKEGIQLGEILKKLSEVEDKIDRHRGNLNQSTTVMSQMVVDPPAKASNPHSSASPLSSTTDSDLKPAVIPSTHQATMQHQPIEPSPKSGIQPHFKSAPADVQNSIRNPAKLTAIWEKTLAALQKESRTLYSSLKAATLLPDEGNQLKIAISPMLIQWIQDDEKKTVAQILTNLLEANIKVNFVSASTVPEVNAPQLARATQQTTPMMLQYEAERDSQISPILNLFEAKILKIELK